MNCYADVDTQKKNIHIIMNIILYVRYVSVMSLERR